MLNPRREPRVSLTMRIHLVLSLVLGLGAGVAGAAPSSKEAPAKKDYTKECESETRSKANGVVDKKVAELEKAKKTYSREKLLAETKRELFDACMKKHK